MIYNEEKWREVKWSPHAEQIHPGTIPKTHTFIHLITYSILIACHVRCHVWLSVFQDNSCKTLENYELLFFESSYENSPLIQVDGWLVWVIDSEQCHYHLLYSCATAMPSQGKKYDYLERKNNEYNIFSWLLYFVSMWFSIFYFRFFCFSTFLRFLVVGCLSVDVFSF